MRYFLHGPPPRDARQPIKLILLKNNQTTVVWSSEIIIPYQLAKGTWCNFDTILLCFSRENSQKSRLCVRDSLVFGGVERLDRGQ